jgi:ABC-type multidrug transport system ATPase subunit
MEQHFEKHQEKFYHALIEGEEKPLRPLLYARLVHSQFVLLAFFSEHDPEIREFLNEYLWIQDLDSVLFIMRQPPKPFRGGDPRFWYARGVVRDFLDKLYEFSLAPVRIKRRVDIEFMSKSNLEHLYLYIKDPDTLQKLANMYSSQQDFFKALESTYISNIFSEVRIKVKIRKMDGSLTFRELSEGEQQLLMVLGLLRFTKEDESLFLLDEPDTHLNPTWSLQYIDFLKKVVGNQLSSHIIMTTHDPLTIAGLLKEQVQLIQRNDEGEIIAVHPDKDPRGMGISGLLTSDVYGLRSELDLETQQKLDRKRELASKEKLSEAEMDTLRELTDELNKLGFVYSFRDSLYSEYVRLMQEEFQDDPDLQSKVLTKEQMERRNAIAKSIIEKLRAEQRDPQ